MLLNGGEVVRIKLAVPTKSRKEVEDVVSKVFGRSKTFTLIELVDREVKDVEVVDNPAISYKHGVGPIVVKMLTEKGVNVVAAREFGPGASALLEQNNIKMVKVEAGTPLNEVIKKVSDEL